MAANSHSPGGLRTAGRGAGDVPVGATDTGYPECDQEPAAATQRPVAATGDEVREMSYDVQLQNEADDYYKHENWKGRAEYAEAELESALTLTARYRADARALLARVEAAEALAYERLESAVFAEQRADDAEVERDELRDANSVLSDALETTRQTLVTLTARVAELEAQLAAQQWRPVTEKPEKPGWYSVYDSDGHVFYNAEIFPYRVARWTGKWDSAFNGLIDYWRPLPPAPQETTP